VDRLAEIGLVTFGVVHLVIGWLAVTLALGDRQGGASSTGAVKQLAQQPFGQFLVWAVALGMVLLVLWRVVEAAIGYRDDDEPKRTWKRLLSGGKALVYASIAFTAFDVATGKAKKGGGGGTDSMTATLMDRPGGQLLVGAVGVGIVAAGVGLLVAAWRETYLKHIDAEGSAGSSGTTYRWLGRVGHVAKGVALGVVGGLFLYAAGTHEAKKSGGLDQALRTVLEQPFGPVLLGAIGLGFAAYGLFCFAQARHLDR
jgi:multisubunit Na+/H+ antiporter MnhB subunit